MRFDLIQVIESMDKEFSAYGTSEISTTMTDSHVQFRLIVTTSSERYNAQFYIPRQLLKDDSNCAFVNELFIKAYFNLRRSIHLGF